MTANSLCALEYCISRVPMVEDGFPKVLDQGAESQQKQIDCQQTVSL